MREILYAVGIVVSIITVSLLIGLVCALPNPHSLSGRVYDNIGNPVEGAEIVLTNKCTNAQLYVKTNVYGEYQEDAYNFVEGYKDGDSIHYYARYEGYKIKDYTTIDISKGGTKHNFVFSFSLGFVTGKGGYPSMSGTYKGTITPNVDITVSSLHTYLCVGTGGHTEYISLNGEEATWNGYTGVWSVLTFDNSFVLKKNKTYEYEIRTGSYPQIIHEERLEVPAGVITCDSFVDANGKVYVNKIPAIRLGEKI
jgi:hypothetical protein